MADLCAASPFGDLAATSGDPACVVLTCLPPRDMLRLRLHDPNDGAGLDLPAAPNTVGGERPWRLWLGPREWLFVDPDGLGDTAARLAAALAGRTHSLTPAAAASFTLAGPQAGAVLARGCPLDLHQLTPGTCARSTLAQVGVLLHRHADASIELHVDVSVARHAASWLQAVVTDMPGLIRP